MLRTIRKPFKFGQTVGRLTIVSSHEKIGKDYFYFCACSCGKSKKRNVRYLRYTPIPSCGCYESEAKSQNAKKNKTHGLTCGSLEERKLYDVLRHMIARCHYDHSKDYAWWGARGISVCQEWRDDPHSFVQWAMNNGYEVGLTIERIDNDGNYHPDNCTWIKNQLQARNRRRKRILTAFGESMSVADWSRKTGVPYKNIMSRLRYGWSHERAVS